MTIRVGIIGWGEIGQVYASLLEEAGAKFSGLVSRRQDVAVNVPVYDSFSEMLPHIDASIIAVPNFLHAALCLQSVRAGKPVLVEKPICISSAELAELEAVLPEKKVPVHVGYRLRWNPSLRQLKKRLQKAGRIECVYRIGIDHLAAGKDWTLKMEKTGGAFFAIGVHSLDLVRWLAGAEGQKLENIKSSASGINRLTDFPISVKMSGTLPAGVELIAGADLTGSSDSVIDLRVEAEKGSYPDPELPPPQPEDEKIEYAGLLKSFIRAVNKYDWDPVYTAEILETHRELIWARSRQQLFSK